MVYSVSTFSCQKRSLKKCFSTENVLCSEDGGTRKVRSVNKGRIYTFLSCFCFCLFAFSFSDWVMWSVLDQIIYRSLFPLAYSFLINIFQAFRLVYMYHEHKNQNHHQQQNKLTKKPQNLSANSHFDNFTLVTIFYWVGILSFCRLGFFCSASLCGVKIV